MKSEFLEMRESLQNSTPSPSATSGNQFISTLPRDDSTLSAFSNTPEFLQFLDSTSLEALVEMKISRFLNQLGKFFPEGLHDLIIAKVERPLLSQILRRSGGNQVQASKILGINRNTLRKKLRQYGLSI